MRPLPGDDAFTGRQWHVDNDQSVLHYSSVAAATPQMTCFLADQDSQSTTASLRHRDRNWELKTAISASSNQPSSPDADSNMPPFPTDMNERNIANYDAAGRLASHPPSSVTMTHVLGVSDHGSAVSGSSSCRNSFAGSFLEDQQSYCSGCDPGPGRGEEAEGESPVMDSGSAPQLIMPSIKMPSRRPFTETGMGLGRLKILVAGGAGVGKTSIIKAIVQTCQHIVHVDTVDPSSSLPVTSSAANKKICNVSKADSSTPSLTEILASSRPYPHWWSDVDDASSLVQRTASVGGDVLQRNLCFVDTAGYSHGSSAMDVIGPVVEYIEMQLCKLCSHTLPDSEMLNLVGGDGGCQVDAVFYVLSGQMNPTDVEYMRHLCHLTNVIPVLSKVDQLSSSDLEAARAQIVSQIQQASLKTFSFSRTNPRAEADPARVLYLVSSATGSDHDTMDASLLMSPDYVKPLFVTDLGRLVESVFSTDGAAWLRHVAARKYLAWKGEHKEPPVHGVPKILPAPRLGPSQLTLSAAGAPVNSHSPAWVADHTRMEERRARIGLANWAAELQRALASERSHYETLARNDRAVWLTERLSECVRDGTLVPRTSSANASKHGRERGEYRLRSSQSARHQDPVGLLEVVIKFKRRGRVALEVLGSLSIIGGLTFWAWRNFRCTSPYEWFFG